MYMMIIWEVQTYSGAWALDDDDCIHDYKWWFSTLDQGSMRSNLDYQRFEIIGGLRSHLLLFFFGRKNILKEKAVSPRSHPAS